MSAALLTYATGRRAVGPMRDIVLAQHINRWCGGAVVAPWDIPQLDEATLDGFELLLTQLPQMQAGAAAIDAAKARIIAAHPTYRKH